MSLPPILYHHFKCPLPYAQTLALQNAIHAIQLARRHTSSPHSDYLLLLEHRPVYTAGRRQALPSSSSSPTDATDALALALDAERARLQRLGADFALTARGGQLTFHGPGQLVGYPLLSLSQSYTHPSSSATTTTTMPVRDYVCRLQRTLRTHLADAHGIVAAPSDHTGIFLADDGVSIDSSPLKKIASIGVQVRHRLTTHGFALNVTRAPLPWFEHIVACGLADVKATAIAGRSRRSSSLKEEDVSVEGEIAGVVSAFGRVFERDMAPLELNTAGDDEVVDAILEMEDVARQSEVESPVPLRPLVS